MSERVGLDADLRGPCDIRGHAQRKDLNMLDGFTPGTDPCERQVRPRTFGLFAVGACALIFIAFVCRHCPPI